MDQKDKDIVKLTNDLVDLDVSAVSAGELERRLELAVASAFLEDCGTNVCDTNGALECGTNYCDTNSQSCGSNTCHVHVAP